MDSPSVLREALAILRRTLKARGFLAKGSTFHQTPAHGNTVLISVQKSAKSSGADTLVTLNYGVYSARLGRRLRDEPGAAFDVMNAHWRKRLAEGGRERWLHVTATDTAEVAAQFILASVEGVLPELFEHSSDEALRDEWLAGSSSGLTDMQRLLFATILVGEIGPAQRLEEVLGELRRLVIGTVQEGLIERRLANAGVRLK